MPSPTLDPAGLALAAAATAAGFVNALAGGGSLISFPALMAAGLPALAANVTNTVALTPGYLGASVGQLAELRDQKARLCGLLPAGLLGGGAGALLLLLSGDGLFGVLVPWLILGGTALLTVQEPLKGWLERVEAPTQAQAMRWWARPAVLLACVYGGFFGAGLSVILLAVLALGLNDTLNRLSGLKQALALSANLSASLLFIATGRVSWSAAALMAGGSILGGIVGGRLAGRVNAVALRRLVVGCGLTIGASYHWRSLRG